MQDSRVVEFPYSGATTKAVKVPDRVRVVPLPQEAEAPVVEPSEFGVPFPLIVMPIFDGTLMPEFHVQEPAGMTMMSPSTAVCPPPTHVPPVLLMHSFTSPREQELAV